MIHQKLVAMILLTNNIYEDQIDVLFDINITIIGKRFTQQYKGVDPLIYNEFLKDIKWGVNAYEYLNLMLKSPRFQSNP